MYNVNGFGDSFNQNSCLRAGSLKDSFRGTLNIFIKHRLSIFAEYPTKNSQGFTECLQSPLPQPRAYHLCWHQSPKMWKRKNNMLKAIYQTILMSTR